MPESRANPIEILIDPGLCRDCQTCALACSLYHAGECHLGLARLRVMKDMARYHSTSSYAGTVLRLIVWQPAPTSRSDLTSAAW